MDDINKYIDKSNNHFTHYDMSIIVNKVFKNLYRYIGANQWEYFDINEKIWKYDKKKTKFKIDIQTIIADIYITRYIYWCSMISTNNDINSNIHSQFMADKMFKASYKLKDNKFITTVIKEAQPFFDIHNNDN